MPSLKQQQQYTINDKSFNLLEILKAYKNKGKTIWLRRCGMKFTAHRHAQQTASSCYDKLHILLKRGLHFSENNCQEEIFLQLLRGTLVWLVTCHKHFLASFSLPLWMLLWEFPDPLLSRKLSAHNTNNLARKKILASTIRTLYFFSVLTILLSLITSLWSKIYA